MTLPGKGDIMAVIFWMREVLRQFTRRQLRVLILPLIVEQFLAVTIGMADSVMVRAVSALCWHRGGR